VRVSSPDPVLEELVRRTSGPQPGRRLFHAGNGLLIWSILHFTTIDSYVAAILLGVAAAIALALDLARLRYPELNRLFFRVLNSLASPREHVGIASSTWYLVGIATALVLFPRPFAEAGVLVLALADPVASWCGRRYGRRRLGTGSWLGSTLFAAVAATILWPVAGPWGAMVVAVLVAGLEVLPWRVDDNLLIPLATSAALWALVGIGG
jgi:dolichol kinase